MHNLELMSVFENIRMESYRYALSYQKVIKPFYKHRMNYSDIFFPCSNLFATIIIPLDALFSSKASLNDHYNCHEESIRNKRKAIFPMQKKIQK